MAAREPGQMKRALAFGLGIGTAFLIVPLVVVEVINALTGDAPLPPLCDGDFENEECVCYFSGQTRPFPGWEVSWGDQLIHPKQD